MLPEQNDDQPVASGLVWSPLSPSRGSASKEKQNDEESSLGAQADGVSEHRRLLNGFPRTARFLASDPGKSAVVFRRFDEVAIRNLLYLEGRLAALEALQREFDDDDYNFYNENKDISTVAVSWEDFALLGTENGQYGANGIPLAAFDIWNKRRQGVLQAAKAAEKLPLKPPQYQRRSDTQASTHDTPAATRATDPHLSTTSLDPITSVAADSSAKPQAEGAFRSRATSVGSVEPTKDLNIDEATLKLIRKRWDLANAIQAALKEFEEAMIRYHQLLKLDSPAPRSAKAVKDWIEGRVDGTIQAKFEQFGRGTAMNSLFKNHDDPNAGEHRTRLNDLVGLRAAAPDDPVSKFFANRKWIYQLNKVKDFPYPEIAYVPEHTIQSYVTVVTMLASLIFLVAAIWSLWAAEKDSYPWQLFVLSAYVISFGVVMKFGSSASKTELLATTAAYAAVLVVFVGKGDKQQATPDAPAVNVTSSN